MKKVSLLVGLLVIVAMLSGCMAFDHATDRYDDGNSNSSRGGHSHH
jgi:hypothetical protein